MVLKSYSKLLPRASYERQKRIAQVSVIGENGTLNFLGKFPYSKVISASLSSFARTAT